MPRNPLRIGAPALTLKPPQHFHVQGFVYQALEDDGKTFTWSSAFDLIANDLELAASRARALAKRPKSHVSSFRQCSEAQHLEGI
ncbi:MAG: hypothetical protein ACRDGB_05720 [Candidatus Limnocylindria bacterium]